MKKKTKSTLIVLVTFLLAALIFTSCKKDADIVSLKPGTAVASQVNNAAQTYMSNEVVDVEQDVWIGCANGGVGENVHLKGQMHLIFEFTSNGNTGHGKYFFQPQQLSGTGEITGDKYQATGVTQGENTSSSINGRFIVIFINNFRIIGQGNGNNFLAHQTVHVTYNANGIITSEVDKITTECK